MKIWVWLLAMALSGCASVPLRTLYHMRDFDPMQADPGLIKVAIRTHEAVKLRKGDTRISLGYEAEDQSLYIQDTYLIDVSALQDVSARLRDGMESDEQVILFTLNDEDARQMRDSQQRIAAHRDTGAVGKGSFGVGVHNLCVTRPLAALEIILDIFIQPDPDTGYLLIQEDFNLAQNADPAHPVTNDWPLCSDVEAQPTLPAS